ncbi:MAG: hypothetical protein J6V14_07680, partial [Clostridia bacterium]|nr:hypothetical protein [Clostridia bacterium]
NPDQVIRIFFFCKQTALSLAKGRKAYQKPLSCDGEAGIRTERQHNRALRKMVKSAWRYAGGISQRGGPFKQI